MEIEANVEVMKAAAEMEVKNGEKRIEGIKAILKAIGEEQGV